MTEPTTFARFVGPAARALGVKLHFSSDESKVTNWGDNVDTPTDEELNAKIVELDAEDKARAWVKKRQADYPSFPELVVALYDTDDKAALETKRAAVKTKWPKDNSGPVE